MGIFAPYPNICAAIDGSGNLLGVTCADVGTDPTQLFNESVNLQVYSNNFSVVNGSTTYCLTATPSNGSYTLGTTLSPDGTCSTMADEFAFASQTFNGQTYMQIKVRDTLGTSGEQCVGQTSNSGTYGLTIEACSTSSLWTDVADQMFNWQIPDLFNPPFL